MAYLFWRIAFRLTPARWVVFGCNGWDSARGRFGRFVTEKYGSAGGFE